MGRTAGTLGPVPAAAAEGPAVPAPTAVGPEAIMGRTAGTLGPVPAAVAEGPAVPAPTAVGPEAEGPEAGPAAVGPVAEGPTAGGVRSWLTCGLKE